MGSLTLIDPIDLGQEGDFLYAIPYIDPVTVLNAFFDTHKKVKKQNLI